MNRIQVLYLLSVLKENTFVLTCILLHRGGIGCFSVQWIHCSSYSECTGQKIDKSHLCALQCTVDFWLPSNLIQLRTIFLLANKAKEISVVGV